MLRLAFFWRPFRRPSSSRPQTTVSWKWTVRSTSRFHPWGTLPSKSVVDWHRSKSVLGFKDRYEVNKWTLMGGDILLLYTDGLQEHERRGDPYFPGRLEHTIRGAKHLSAIDIVHTVFDDLRTFANPADDVSLVVIKKL